MSSPMQWISPVTPPPSFTSVRTPAKCKNPFDANLTEHLHLETFSPSVFSQVLSPSDDNDSNWRIEHVALLNPTDFSPNFHSHMADPATEAEAQEKILQFFSQKQIAPSPWSQPRSRVLNRSKSKTPAEVSKPAASSKNGTIYSVFFFTRAQPSFPSFSSAWTQTCLSFPPKLPQEVEEILRQYCTNEPQEDTGHSPVGNSSESEDSSLLNASSLRRKLFSQMGNTPSKGEEFGPVSLHFVKL
jgi:protein aurora borealis